MAGPPTIYDVATAAGVATSTVSRAFSTPGTGQARDPGAGAGRRRGARLPAQPARPRAAVGPAPHGGDGGLRHHQPALLRADPRRRDARQASEYTLVLVNAEESPRIEYDQIQRLAPSVDGFVLAASRLPDENLPADRRPAAGRADEPGAARPAQRRSSTTSRAAARSWQHLASLGHRDLVYLAGPRNSWMATTRWSALRTAAEQVWDVAPSGSARSRPRCARAALPRTARSTRATSAIVAHNDLLAIGVVQRLAQRGLRVPDDVSVVGFDDIFAADLCTPRSPRSAARTPTSAAQRWRCCSTAASRRPDDQPCVVLPTELVLRDSTGPLFDHRADASGRVWR